MRATAKKSKWGRRWWWIPQLLALPITGLAWLGMATDVALLAPLSLLLPYLVLYHVGWGMMATAHLHPSALLGGTLLALLWTPMGSWMQVRRPAALARDPQVSMASWNVHHWRNRTWTDDSATVHEMAQFAVNLDVDVLALQDVRRGTAAESFLGAELTHRVEAYDLALYSRYPIVQWDQVDYPGDSGRIGFIWADLLLPAGDTVRVVNVHLVSTDVDLREAQSEHAKAGWWQSAKLLLRRMVRRAEPRSVQVEALAEWWSASPRPVVVLGDFNDSPTSASHRRLRELGRDSFVQSGAGWGSTYRGLRVVPLRIDWVWTSGPWVALEHQVVKQKWSDHNPLRVAMSGN
ncbi:MAG: endonuclease/exonuclease/phosphatase family protein [Bacteroidota bacterium]